MGGRLIKTAATVVALFAAAQLVRPDYSAPETDPAHAIRSQRGTSPELAALVDRSCGDCHSNHTDWPGYTRVAPLSWVVARAVGEGRRAVNFSDWTDYPPHQRRALLLASCRTATAGTMPGAAYTWVRPDARLSHRDVETVCAASR
jgi:hypothetical protein